MVPRCSWDHRVPKWVHRTIIVVRFPAWPTIETDFFYQLQYHWGHSSVCIAPPSYYWQTLMLLAPSRVACICLNDSGVTPLSTHLRTRVLLAFTGLTTQSQDGSARVSSILSVGITYSSQTTFRFCVVLLCDFSCAADRVGYDFYKRMFLYKLSCVYLKVEDHLLT